METEVLCIHCKKSLSETECSHPLQEFEMNQQSSKWHFLQRGLHMLQIHSEGSNFWFWSEMILTKLMMSSCEQLIWSKWRINLCVMTNRLQCQGINLMVKRQSWVGYCCVFNSTFLLLFISRTHAQKQIHGICKEFICSWQIEISNYLFWTDRETLPANQKLCVIGHYPRQLYREVELSFWGKCKRKKNTQILILSVKTPRECGKTFCDINCLFFSS